MRPAGLCSRGVTTRAVLRSTGYTRSNSAGRCGRSRYRRVRRKACPPFTALRMVDFDVPACCPASPKLNPGMVSRPPQCGKERCGGMVYARLAAFQPDHLA